MRSLSYFSYLYDFVLLFAFLCVIYRYKILDHASKIFSLFVALSLLSETIGIYASIKYRSNLPVYGIDSLFEFGLISLYFNSSIDVFRRKNIGYYIGALGIVLGIVNLIFVQGFNTLNSYFLVFEGICIIGMALFSFFRLLLRYDNLQLQKYPHFWLATILVFFWSATFINWSLYDYFFVKLRDMMWIVDLSIISAGIVTYIGISCVFILYPRMRKTL